VTKIVQTENQTTRWSTFLIPVSTSNRTVC